MHILWIKLLKFYEQENVFFLKIEKKLKSYKIALPVIFRKTTELPNSQQNMYKSPLSTNKDHDVYKNTYIIKQLELYFI